LFKNHKKISQKSKFLQKSEHLAKKNLVKPTKYFNLGVSLDGAFMGTIGRTVAPVTKSQAFAVLLLVRQAGMVAGPMLVFGLEKMDFYIGAVHVDKYSSPGFVLAVFWERVYCVRLLIPSLKLAILNRVLI